MKFKYRNYELNLKEDILSLKQEINELERLVDLIDKDAHYEILAGKTQLIGKNKVENMRSRIKHSENIATISKRFIRSVYETVVDDEIKDSEIYQLNLQKELLYAHIVSKAHDWGHAPFGHLGERILNKCIQDTKIPAQNLQKILARKKQIYGEQYETLQGHTEDYNNSISFEHNEQSAKLLYDFIHQKGIDLQKVDLSKLINAVLAHSTSRVKQDYIPKDIVAQIVRQADKIEEYAANDFEEIKNFINLDIITDKRLSSYLKLDKAERVKLTLQHLLEETLEKGYIDDEMKALEYAKKMKKLYQKIVFFVDTDGKKGLLTGENEERITLMLRKVFEYYMSHPEKIPYATSRYVHIVDQDEKGERVTFKNSLLTEEVVAEERTLDYICQMDNETVERNYQRLVKERLLKGSGNGINPITESEIQSIKQDLFTRQISFIRLKEETEGVEHSKEECIRVFEEEVENIKKNAMTNQARQRISELRVLHKQENERDAEMCRLMELYDKVPDARRKAIETENDKKIKHLKNSYLSNTHNR